MVVWYLLLGLLIGWLVEWVIDWWYWRGRWQNTLADLEACRQSLAEERERTRMLQAKMHSFEEELKGLRARVQQLESERDRFKDERDAALAELRSQEPRTAAPEAAPAGAADDLKKIEGIGPKIEELLNRKGIRTFRQLAQTSVEQLRAILQEAGPRFRLADPTTWPRQAQMAAEERWDELQDYQDALQGGREG
ncbi:MAG TPA: hypothetical protein ENK37_02000 [Oceanithermus profundus]|uniref:DUF4332 domain-containing protein n=1 Tax=Oceanithermus profundus TaxID=187137 RepID=A0A7C4Z484_9DEIN|nr:hypothetical protein [Oceanithermus profundus]